MRRFAQGNSHTLEDDVKVAFGMKSLQDGHDLVMPNAVDHLELLAEVTN